VALLNENQARRLKVTCQYIDKLLSDMEGVLNVSASKAAFPKISPDLSPAQRRTVEDYIVRVRAQLVRVLDGQGIAREDPKIPETRSLMAYLTAVDIAVEELAPSYMRGYGGLAEGVPTELNGIVGELESLVTQLERYITQCSSGDLRDRLQRLEQTADETQLLSRIESVVSARGLVEFRPAITNILERLEDKTFEIAVFGRVSSGKSSLLNAILESDVLPVGVTPVTSVPTRVSFGNEAKITVWFAERPTQTQEISRLAEYVTEQSNPGNRRNVTRVLVRLPSPRLQDGVTFVDTPGLGSLATSGAAETLAYLPKCDLGVFLIDAASTLTPDDLKTVQALNEAAIPIHVLLSKADLLTPPELERVTAYVKEHLASECRLDCDVSYVSVLSTHRNLLDEWFSQRIATLFARARELRTASIKRKVGALRESVVASLEARLRRAKGLSPDKRDEIRGLEARLRRTTGHIEETRKFCENESEKLAREGGSALVTAARLLFDSWATAEGNPEEQSRIVASAVQEYVRERASRVHEQLRALTSEFAGELRAAASALELADAPAQEEFDEVLRNSPIFEMSEPQVRVAPSVFGSLRSRSGTEKHLAKQLMNQVGPRLHEGLETYANLLKSWAERTLAHLRRRFDSYADTYRAQAERTVGSNQLSENEESQILRDLQALQGSQPLSQDGGSEFSDGQRPDQFAGTRSSKP
jgi:GTP-binding protein EngB required for normal cell division